MVTVEDFEHAVRELAAENPDVVYNSLDGNCANNAGTCSNGTCGCIIGQAAVRLNAYDKEYPAGSGDEDADGAGIDPRIADDLILDITLNLPRSNWFDEVQSAQDAGHPWAKAVTIADKATEGHDD